MNNTRRLKLEQLNGNQPSFALLFSSLFFLFLMKKISKGVFLINIPMHFTPPVPQIFNNCWLFQLHHTLFSYLSNKQLSLHRPWKHEWACKVCQLLYSAYSTRVPGPSIQPSVPPDRHPTTTHSPLNCLCFAISDVTSRPRLFSLGLGLQTADSGKVTKCTGDLTFSPETKHI